MTDVRQRFITTRRPYTEGAVEVFEQPLQGKGAVKATLTITALGVYEAEIDGQKVGDILFAPGYTYYPRELQVQTYDVTALLKDESVLRVYLGQGWYCGRFTCDNKTQIYGERPAVAWALTVERAGGPAEVFSSTDPAVMAVPSPYGYAGFYDGEVYYGAGAVREEPPEVFPPVPWEGDLPEVFDETILSVRLREEMPVRSVTRHGAASILDFGQNFAGVVEIDPARLPQGAVLRLRHGEILNADGSLYTANLRKAKAEIVYHHGTGTEPYRPRFTYMGFRYVELTGAEYVPGLITARAIYSDMERTGEFACDEPAVDQLYRNQVWGQKSNYVEVPTDCPQRDERMGYTGDGHVFARTGMYNFDTEAFWAKFLRDIRYSQMDNTEGYVAPTIPAQGKAGVGFINMLGWGSAVTILPELLYWQYGTDRYLREQYESMKAHVACEIRHMGGLMGKKDLWIGPNLGDWLMPDRDVKWMAMHNGPVSNAFIVNDLRILSETARRLGREKDAGRCAGQLERTRAAYLKAFVRKDGTMKDDYQGAYIMALRFVVPRGALWDSLFAHLVERLQRDGMQTGFFSTQHLLPLLAENGQAELAHDLLLQPNCPGWRYQVERGATTIWERWDSLRPDGTVNESKMSGDNMVSFNHYAFGSVGEFYYRYILGIQPEEPGFRKIRIAPVADRRLGRVSGSCRTRQGTVRVAWHYTGDRVSLTAETPAETIVCLPDGRESWVQPGRAEFSWTV